MNLSQPYYIDPREGSAHLSLNGKWDFTYADQETAPGLISWNMTTSIPNSVYWSLYEAGVTPHPHEKNNSKQYAWVDQKIWYYRKTFTVDESLRAAHAFLCFEGAAYYTRVFLNGEELGTHEGMFGGPVVDIADRLNYGAENQLVVEVKACDYGYEEGAWNPHNRDLSVINYPIIPWNLARDKQSTPGDFIVIGLWGGVRIEFLPEYHLSRPYLATEKIEDGRATVHFEVELSDPDVDELACMLGDSHANWNSMAFCFAAGTPRQKKPRVFDIRLKLTDRKTGEVIYDEREPFSPLDWPSTGIEKKYFECHHYQRTITLSSYKLWQINGLGEPNLYDAQVTLIDEAGHVLDAHTLPFGVRTVEQTFSAGEKLRARWDKFQFVVNGKKIFLTGVNWMPVEFLLKLDPEEYRWSLERARDAGVQLIRIWNGGGIQETETFYNLCDELGLMVWQDAFPANNETSNWDHTVLLNQEAMTLYRIRKHPSLVVHCGGNEFNPYSNDNLASMAVMEELAEDLDPTRIFMRTTPDRGSTHIYNDMEPTWYRHLFTNLPFVGESGIHSFPCYKSLRQQISPEEFNRPLSNIFTSEFEEKNPELRNHFCEFVPERIPRMMSRASAINDVNGISLEDLVEATQIASCEFYEVMIQAMRENYPVTVGLMPWVYRRPSVAVGIQLMDGLGDPIAPFYYLKQAYKPLMAMVSLPQLTWAVGEDVPLTVRVINANFVSDEAHTLTVRVLNPNLSVTWERAQAVSLKEDTYQTVYELPSFHIPESFRERFFFIQAALTDGQGRLVSQSFYWPKALERMEDEAFRTERRARMQPNLSFDKGPWLKPQIASGAQTSLQVRLLSSERKANRMTFDLEIVNAGSVPAFPVRIDTAEDGTVCAAEDSFFLLMPGETRVLHADVLLHKNAPEQVHAFVTAWNAGRVDLAL